MIRDSGNVLITRHNADRVHIQADHSINAQDGGNNGGYNRVF